MTVAELRQELSVIPDDYKVKIAGYDDYEYFKDRVCVAVSGDAKIVDVSNVNRSLWIVGLDSDA